MSQIVKTYKIVSATCKVLANIDWFGNYKLYSITEKDTQYVGEARNVHQYFNRFVEVIKDRVLKNISDINNVKWNVKGFDDTISLHFLIREVGKILEKFIKVELTKKYPHYAYYINNHNINFDKTIVVEITDNDKIICVANLTVEPFI